MSGHNIAGKQVAFLLTDGVEQVELTSPWNAVEEAGGQPILVSPRNGKLQGYQGAERAGTFARAFFEQHKPVAAICHGPWLLIDAGVVRGRNMTSYRTLQTDLKNAGANWTDQEVVVDQGLVTSRNPRDLPAFNDKILKEIEEGEHAGQTG